MTVEVIKALGERFIQRKDVKAIQHDDGSWAPIREKFSLQDFNDHLSGKKTFGHYMLAPEGQVKLFAYDIDLRKIQPDESKPGYWHPAWQAEFMDRPAEGPLFDPRAVWLDWTQQEKGDEIWLECLLELRVLAEGLAHAVDRLSGGEIHVAVADSGGKGLHVYGFTGSIDAKEARELAVAVLDSFGGEFRPSRGDNFYRHENAYELLEIEVFPKQDSLDGKDLGNLMRLPLGINRKSGNPSRFVSLKNGPTEPLQEMDPVNALGGDLPWD